MSTWQRVTKKTRDFSGFLFVCLMAIDLPKSHPKSGIILAFKIHGVGDWMCTATVWHGRESKISLTTDPLWSLHIDLCRLSRHGKVSRYHSLTLAAPGLSFSVFVFFLSTICSCPHHSFASSQGHSLHAWHRNSRPQTNMRPALSLRDYWCKWQLHLIDKDLHLTEMFGFTLKGTHAGQAWCQNLTAEVTSQFYINKMGYRFTIDHLSAN